MSISPKLNYRVNAITTKSPSGFLVDFNKLILKLAYKGKGTTKTILKKDKVGEHIISDFETYDKATIIKRV